jgi:hypothetical protein
LKNKYLLLGIGLCLVVISALAYLLLQKSHSPKASAKHPYDFSGPCPGEVKTLKMDDDSMIGIIDSGTSYKLTSDWYWCHPVKRGDLVLLRFSHSMDPVVRKVYGVPDDEFKVTFNKSQAAWNVEIESQKVEVKGAPYFFGSNSSSAPPLLKLLENSREGVLLDREIIVFSSTPPGNKDSGTLGVVNLNDVVGKVEPIN